MLIRPFKNTDRRAVVALWRSVFGYPQPHNNPELTIRKKLALQRKLFFVAIVDGTLAGTAMGGYDGHRGWIYSLAVVPERRRQGIGTALMRHVERALAELGCPKINLQALPGNDDAVALYERLGYRIEDRISMGKVL
ncbi:MAG: GNAT family acetyltransferase [Pirellulales bacterium]